MKINKDIVKQSADYVRLFIPNKLSKNYCYHDLSHAINVVNAVHEIVEGMKLTDHERHILLTAAWFHDIGYIWQIEGHEIAGAGIAEAFLRNKEVDEQDIEQVKACILATKYPQKPSSVLEQVICDADLLHLGRKDCFEKAALIREEWVLTRQKQYSDSEWRELNLDFMKQHHFHTSYCREHYSKRKKKNCRQIRKLMEEENQPVTASSTAAVNMENERLPEKLKLERGVETFFKTTSRNHMQLSSMADSKAHILLSINSIIISIVISVLMRRLEQSTYLIFPTALLLCVCLTTLVFAVLTTQPKISKGIFTREQVAKREANLMFFGNFHKMDLKTYAWGVKEIMSDNHYLYSSLTRDVYYLGKVLAIKYRYLNIGYKVFMFGLIASVLAFGICFSCAHRGA